VHNTHVGYSEKKTVLHNFHAQSSNIWRLPRNISAAQKLPPIIVNYKEDHFLVGLYRGRSEASCAQDIFNRLTGGACLISGKSAVSNLDHQLFYSTVVVLSFTLFIDIHI